MTGEAMNEIERLKKAILEEYPRLTPDSEFSFACHPGVSCFNACCADVNIFLTPYDIIRLKKRLGIDSSEFLSRYTLSPFDKNARYPIIMLKMNEDEKKTCPFVTSEGCSVYDDRPWPCRMYPLGLASPKDDPKNVDREFHFLLKEDVCKGHGEKTTQTVRQWLDDQGITEYNAMGEQFKQITLHRFFDSGGRLSPEQMEVFFTSCYNIDRFREYILETSFLDKFDVDEETVEKMRTDDVELLKFAYRWIRFAIFREPTMQIKADVVKARREEMAKKEKS